MKSRIYKGQVMHHRLQPVNHRWTYPYYFYAFDLSELPELDRTVRGFGFNRWRPVCLQEKDFQRGKGFADLIDPDRYDRVILITVARFLIKSFIPVSFYYCIKNERTVCIITEVNNTFHERHFYSLDADEPFPVTCHHSKEFHVSPFNDMNGSYTFTFSEPGDRLSIDIQLIRDGEVILHAGMKGDGEPLTTPALWKTVFTHLFTAAMTFPKILWQAVLLKYKYKQPVYPHPEPASSATMKVNS